MRRNSRTTTPSGQRGPAVPGSGSVWVATAVVANRTLREDIGLAGSCEYGGSFFSSGARRGGRTAILELLRGLWCHVPTRGRPQPGEPESLRSGGGSALSSADGGGGRPRAALPKRLFQICEVASLAAQRPWEEAGSLALSL